MIEIDRASLYKAGLSFEEIASLELAESQIEKGEVISQAEMESFINSPLRAR